MTASTILVELLDEPAENPNVMSDDIYQGLVEGIRKGFRQPILITPRNGRYEIVDGVHRVRAVKELGMGEVPCVIADLSPRQAMATRIAMNRLRGELDLATVGRQSDLLLASGEWDITTLAQEIGFSEEELTALMVTIQPSDHEILGSSAGTVDTGALDSVTNPKPYVLEVEFKDRADFQRAKRGLRKAAGTTKDLSRGLLRLLGDE